jgi:hypothetical protein
MLMAVITLLVSQLPQGVQDLGVELGRQGGYATAFAIVCVVAAAEAAAIAYLFKDGRAFQREMTGKLLDLTGGLGGALKESAQSTKENTAALMTLNTTNATLVAKVEARG